MRDPIQAISYSSGTVKEIDVLCWITASLGCDGDTISMTAATQPSIEDIIHGQIPLDSQSHASQSFPCPRQWRRFP